MQHPAVLEAAVIGVPDEHGLTRTKAFVVVEGRRHGVDRRSPTSSRRSSRSASRPHKYPREIEFVAELPKTATGKIQRFNLRERRAARSRRRPAATQTRRRNPRVAIDVARPRVAHRIPPHRRRRLAHRSSSSCTKASAPSRCGATSPRAVRGARGYRGLVFSRPGYGRRRRGRTTSAGPPTSCIARRRRAAAAVRRARRRCRAATVALRSQRRRLDRADPCRAVPSRVAGLVVVAPHLDRRRRLGVDSIAQTRVAYLETDLRDKLARHHADVDSAFWGWNDVWLSAAVQPLRHPRAAAADPLSGARDPGPRRPYGTMAHIDGIARRVARTRRCQARRLRTLAASRSAGRRDRCGHRFVDAHAHGGRNDDPQHRDSKQSIVRETP